MSGEPQHQSIAIFSHQVIQDRVIDYRDHRVGVGHHGDEQVQQDDDVDDTVGAEQKQTPEPGVGLDATEVEGVQTHHAETGPEQ